MAKLRVKDNGIIHIDFRYRNARHVMSTGLKDTKPNARLAIFKLRAIEHDIRLNCLDIHKYFPKYVDKNVVKSDTLTDFFDYYIKEKNIRSGSMKNLLWAWEKYIDPQLGSLKLIDITRHEILVFRNTIAEKVAGSTANLVMVHLAGILTRAHDEGRLASYPMKRIGKLDSRTEPVDPFSFDELAHFLDFLYSGSYPEADMIFVWSQCGFRHGEILGLKWDDLDYHNRKIAVNRTVLNNGEEGLPKTRSSIRPIDLSDDTIGAFKRQERRSRLASDYIFTDPITGKRYKMPIVFWHRFKNLLKLAGLKYRSPNQLRHTFATLSIAAGENITWVSKTMGHRTVTTTLDRYNRFVPNLTRKDGSAYQNTLKNHRNGYSLVTAKDKLLEL